MSDQTSQTAAWTPVCAAGDVPEGEARAITVDGRRLCVINAPDGWFALDDLCNHGQAYLSEGYCDTDDCQIECPLHGGLFDYRDGSPQGDPVDKPMRTYPLRLTGGTVEVAL